MCYTLTIQIYCHPLTLRLETLSDDEVELATATLG